MLKNFLNFKWLQLVFIAGAATGAAVGAVAGLGMGFGAGLLLAQKPGKELRDELTDKTCELVDELKTKAGAVKERMGSLVSSAEGNGHNGNAEV